MIMKTHLFAVMTITAVLAMTATTWGAMGLDTDTADLPPDGKYVSSQQFFEYTIPGLGDIVVENPTLSRPHTGTIARAAVGSDEQEDFDATLSGVEIGLGVGPLEVSGPVVVMTYGRLLSTTGTPSLRKSSRRVSWATRRWDR